jgi:hypothetical protein
MASHSSKGDLLFCPVARDLAAVVDAQGTCTKPDDLEQSTRHRHILQEVDDVIRIGAKLEWKNTAVASGARRLSSAP